MNNEEFISWENNLGFKSLKTVFDEFVIEENKMWDKLSKEYKGREKDLTKEKVKEKYKDVTKKNEKSFTVVTMDDGGQYYDMNLYRSNFAPIVNENGIVAIGEEIYRFTMQDERSIKNEDWNKINELMKENSKDVHYKNMGY